MNISKTQKQSQKLVAEKRFDAIIEDVTRNCYDQTSSMGQKDEAVGILATGLLHYLLTSALISSQRKIKYGNQEIDIVIPDIKTLQKDPKKSLIICIPKSSDRVIIENKISELEKIQPQKDNIWVVLSEKQDLERKMFVLKKQNGTFSKIIFEIAKFSNVGGTNNLKILRV